MARYMNHNMGLCLRFFNAASTVPLPIIGTGAAVDEITISASGKFRRYPAGKYRGRSVHRRF